MNWPSIVLTLTLVLTACAQTPPPPPDWARFEAPTRVMIQGYDGDAMEPFLSRDGAILLFNNRNDPPEQTDLHWAERIDDATFRYRGSVEGANSAHLDGVPTVTRDGRFCFVSPRAYEATLATIHCGAWDGARISGVTLEREASPRIPGRVIFDVELAADGGVMILTQGDFRGGAGPHTADLRQARWVDGAYRLAPGDDHLFAAVNTNALEYAAALSADMRMLAFTRVEGRPPFARISIWIARRNSPTEPFGPPVRITALDGFVEAPTFSPDDRTLYYHRLEGSRFSLWRAALARN